MHLRHYYRGRQYVHLIHIIITLQNDFHDCYRPNRIGTDIQRGQISWLYCVAYQKSNEEQKNILRNYYGKGDSESVNIVKKIYDDLDVKGEWFNHLNKSLVEIQDLVDQLPERSAKPAFNYCIQLLRSNYEHDKKKR